MAMASTQSSLLKSASRSVRLSRPQPYLRPAQRHVTAMAGANGDSVPTVTEQPLLLYNWACPFVQRVTLALAFKKISVAQVDIDLSNKPPWLTKYSPLGKVPAVTYLEGGEQQVLYESLALVFWVEEYFADKGVQLLPSSPAQRTLARIIISRFDNSYVPASYHLLRAQDIDEFKTKLQAARAELTWLEEHSYLAKNKDGFLFGPEPSLVDAVVAPWLLRGALIKHWRNVDLLAHHPRLSAYVDRLKALPEVQGNLNSPKGSGWDTWTGALNEGYGRFAQTRLDFSAVDSAQEGDAVASVKVSAVDTPVKVAA